MFISFEGMEGAGKSTLITGLAGWFAAAGRAVTVTREPGGTDLGRSLRAILLDPANTDIVSRAELYLYLADRAQHVEQVIRPALDRGEVVLSDRYADSSIVYQGYGRGLDLDALVRLNDEAVAGLWPDLTIVLDLDPAVGLNRARARNHQDGLEANEGRFEAEALSFHRKVREGFLAWAERNQGRMAVIDGASPPDAVLARAVELVEQRMVPTP